MNENASYSAAAIANLALPGAGLILLGDWIQGTVIGLAFAASANLALAATGLVPDAFHPVVRGLIIGITGGLYVGAQLRLRNRWHLHLEQAAERQRRNALKEVHDSLRRGAFEDALAALAPIADRAQDDLLVAFRLAQALTGTGDREAARAAWEYVRALDRHGIYRDEIRANLTTPDHQQ